MRQLIGHIKETKPLLRRQGWKDILLIVAGALDTDPADVERFGEEKTFALLKEIKPESDLEGVPLRERVSLPVEGKYPDAGFDWMLVRPVEGVRWNTKVVVAGCWRCRGTKVCPRRPSLILWHLFENTPAPKNHLCQELHSPATTKHHWSEPEKEQ